MRWNLDENENTGIDMAPMIDCVFLLLIFFLVSTMVKKMDRDIEVELPISQSALEMKPDDTIAVVGINKEGEFFWEGQATSANILHTTLAELADTDPEKRLRLDCDQATPFHKVVEVLDMCAFRGLRNVGVRTYDEHYNR